MAYQYNFPGQLLARVLLNRFDAARRRIFPKRSQGEGRFAPAKRWVMQWEGIILGGAFLSGLLGMGLKVYLQERADDMARRLERRRFYQGSCEIAGYQLAYVQHSLDFWEDLLQQSTARKAAAHKATQLHEAQVQQLQQKVRMWQQRLHSMGRSTAKPPASAKTGRIGAEPAGQPEGAAGSAAAVAAAATGAAAAAAATDLAGGAAVAAAVPTEAEASPAATAFHHGGTEAWSSHPPSSAESVLESAPAVAEVVAESAAIAAVGRLLSSPACAPAQQPGVSKTSSQIGAAAAPVDPNTAAEAVSQASRPSVSSSSAAAAALVGPNTAAGSEAFPPLAAAAAALVGPNRAAGSEASPPSAAAGAVANPMAHPMLPQAFPFPPDQPPPPAAAAAPTGVGMGTTDTSPPDPLGATAAAAKGEIDTDMLKAAASSAEAAATAGRGTGRGGMAAAESGPHEPLLQPLNSAGAEIQSTGPEAGPLPAFLAQTLSAVVPAMLLGSAAEAAGAEASAASAVRGETDKQQLQQGSFAPSLGRAAAATVAFVEEGRGPEEPFCVFVEEDGMSEALYTTEQGNANGSHNSSSSLSDKGSSSSSSSSDCSVEPCTPDDSRSSSSIPSSSSSSYNPWHWFCRSKLQQAEAQLLEAVQFHAAAEEGLVLWRRAVSVGQQQVQRLHGQKAVHLSILSSHDQEYNTWNDLAQGNRDVMVQIDFAPKWAGHAVPQDIARASNDGEGPTMDSSGSGHEGVQECNQSSRSSSSSSGNTSSTDVEEEEGGGMLLRTWREVSGAAGGSKVIHVDAGGGCSKATEAEGASSSTSKDGAGGGPQHQGVCSSRWQWTVYVLFSRPTWIPAELEDREIDALIEQLVEQLGNWAAEAHLTEL